MEVASYGNVNVTTLACFHSASDHLEPYIRAFYSPRPVLWGILSVSVDDMFEDNF